MRVKADGSGEPELVLNGRVTRTGANVVRPGSASRSLSPDGTTLAMVSDGPDPTESDVVLQFYDLHDEEAHRPEARPRRRRSATRTRPGGPTARCSLYVRNGRERRPRRAGDLPLERGDTKGVAADRAGLPRAVVLARRPVHRGDEDEQLRQRRRHPRRARTAASCCGSPTTATRGRRSGRRPATRSRSSTSSGQIVDLKLARARRARRRAGRSRTSRRLTEVSGLDGESRPDWFVPRRPAAASPTPPSERPLAGRHPASPAS